MFKKILKSWVVAIAVSSGLLSSISSHAAWVTVTGANFDISYDSAAVGAYGTPLILGNTIVFTPSEMYTNFDTLSEEVNSWTTSILVNPRNNFLPTTLTLGEHGDYSFESFSSSFPLPQGALAEFWVDARLFVSSSSNPIGNLEFLKSSYAFSETEQTNLGLWSFEETFSIADYSDGFLLTIQNTLDFENNEGEAFIQKKFVGVELVSTVETPVPGALWLMGSALISLGAYRRKS